MCSGLLPFLVSLLRAHPRDEHIVLEAASVLKNFAFANDAARSACAAAEAATAVMCVLSRSPHALPPFFVLTTHRPRETKPREAALFPRMPPMQLILFVFMHVLDSGASPSSSLPCVCLLRNLAIRWVVVQMGAESCVRGSRFCAALTIFAANVMR